MIAVEKSFEGERENYRKQLRMVETRNNDLDRKIRHLEFDFGDSVKSSMQTEITNLRNQNQTKQEQISKLENLEI